MMTKDDAVVALVTTWKRLAETFSAWGAEDQAGVLTRCTAELEAVLRKAEEEPLTLAEAARQSGYSADHLGRLLRAGKLPNAGRHNSPAILRKHLPIKPGLRTMPRSLTLLGASPGQIARSVVTSNN